MIAKPQNAAFASWITGWFNLLGQVAVTTGIGCATESPLRSWRLYVLPSPSFACANFISTLCTIRTDFQPSSGKTIGIYAAVLFTQGQWPLWRFVLPEPNAPQV
jgi:hypothetical protein